MPYDKIEVEVSAGELLDKISILEIKHERIEEEEKLRNVREELECLMKVREKSIPDNKDIDEIFLQLKSTNELLWEIEDKIRECEKMKDFGTEFIKLARCVYLHNDRRCQLKKELNIKLGSRLIEEKSYTEYYFNN